MSDPIKHPPMTYAEYAAMPGIRCSDLKHMRTSPMHYSYHRTHPPKQTDAMLVGSASHTAVFEPERFLLDYRLWDGGRRAGKRWLEFSAEAAADGITVLTLNQYDHCIAIGKAVRAHPEAGIILAQGTPENVHTWTDPSTGLGCKCRTDWATDEWWLYDLKTTSKFNPRQFAAQVADLGYWFQLAMYWEGVTQSGGTVSMAGIIAVESAAPHDVAVWHPSLATMAQAEDEYHAALGRVKDCMDTGIWPGAGYGGELDPPVWATPDERMPDMSGTPLDA